ncbi:MAG: hypothetical protein ACLTXL_08045 [Clostridia bacterium]
MGDVRILAGFLTGSYGGVERYMMENFRLLNRTKFSMDFLTSASDVPFEAELRQAGATVYHIHPLSTASLLPGDPENFAASPTAASTRTSHRFIGGGGRCREKEVPVGPFSRHIRRNRTREVVCRLHRICKPMLKRNTDYFGACSLEAAAWMFPGDVVKSGRVHILKNAIDIHTFEYDESVRTKVRRELNVEADTVVLGHVGNFMPVKNHRFLLEIFQAFLALNSNARLLLLGTESYRAR